MQKEISIYIDEYGTNSLECSKSGVTDLFIITAIIVNNEDIGRLSDILVDISNRRRGGQELKSSKIGSNSAKRIEYLNDLQDAPFSYYSFIVNKTKIAKNSPFQYKKTFYKWVNKQLLQRIKFQYGVKIYSDEIGSLDFRNSFDSYFAKSNIAELFNQFEHVFENSATCPIVGLADIISGTLSYCFEESKRSEDSQRIRNLIKPKEIAISTFPYNINFFKESKSNSDDFDKLIRPQLLHNAQDFIRRYYNDFDEKRQMQIITLEKLLYLSIYEEPVNRTIFIDELLDLLNKYGYEIKSKNTFISSVIAPIRDAGIIIAGSNYGYELATTKSEIDKFLEHDRKVILPMLSRINKAREAVKKYSNNKFDIMQNNELTTILETFVEHNLLIDTSSSEISSDSNNV